MIYLIRHADAIAGEVDAERPLSERGRRQVEQLCSIFRDSGLFNPAEVWHSPLVRARETAHLLVQGLALGCPLFEKPDLQPEDDPGRIAAVLAAQTRNVAIVGHEPHMGSLAAMLLHGAQPGSAYFPFPKAGVLAVSKNETGWSGGWIARAS